jgi:hypothetical protein
MLPSCRLLAGGFEQDLTGSELPQASLITIELVTIATIRIVVVVLPDSLVRPTTGNGTGSTGIPGQDKRVVVDKGIRVSSASLPPGRVGVNQRVAAGLAVVSVAEVFDPADDRRRREAMALALGRRLEIQHSWKRDPILGPTSSILEEVVRLCGAGTRVHVGKVVTTPDQISLCGSIVVSAEGLCLEGGTLGGLLRGLELCSDSI